MNEILAFDTADGSQVLFAAPDDDIDVELVARSAGDVIPTGSTLDEAMASIRSASRSIIDVIRDMDHVPDEVTVNFGILMTAKVGAVIASAEAQGQIGVSLTWKSGDRDRGE
jgi:hypothetical protein